MVYLNTFKENAGKNSFDLISYSKNEQYGSNRVRTTLLIHYVPSITVVWLKQETTEKQEIEDIP